MLMRSPSKRLDGRRGGEARLRRPDPVKRGMPIMLVASTLESTDTMANCPAVAPFCGPRRLASCGFRNIRRIILDFEIIYLSRPKKPKVPGFLHGDRKPR